MFDKEKQSYDDITIPDNIDQFVINGMNKGRKMRNKTIIKRISSLAACFIIALFITLVRVSPVFASYLSDIPILENIVKLINYDKGLKSAVENNFMQQINIFAEHEDIKFTVDNIIVDEARMIIFYTLENNSTYNEIGLGRIDLLDEKGERLKAAFSYESMTKHKNEDPKSSGIIDISFNEETVIPDTLSMKVRLEDRSYNGNSDKAVNEHYSSTPPKMEELSSTWEIEMPIDKSEFVDMKEEYALNQSVIVENQKINFGNVTIYPTRIAVDVTFDPDNTKKIFRFDDLSFVDEKGEVWASINNGVSASIINDNHIILYFQSNYFQKPNKLYLKGTSMRALDKDQLDVVFDLDNKKLLKAPDDRLKYNDYFIDEENITLSFLLKKDIPKDESFMYMPFSSEYTDAAGSKYHNAGSGSSGMESNGGYNNEIMLHIPKNEAYVSPLTFKLDDYPTRIYGSFEIKIK